MVIDWQCCSLVLTGVMRRDVMSCDVMWWVVMWWAVMWCVVMCSDVLWCDELCCDVLWCNESWCKELWCDELCCDVMWRVATISFQWRVISYSTMFKYCFCTVSARRKDTHRSKYGSRVGCYVTAQSRTNLKQNKTTLIFDNPTLERVSTCETFIFNERCFPIRWQEMQRKCKTVNSFLNNKSPINKTVLLLQRFQFPVCGRAKWRG